jgi:hypothetical protein
VMKARKTPLIYRIYLKKRVNQFGAVFHNWSISSNIFY